MSEENEGAPEPIDTLASYVETPQCRPRIVTRFGPRMIYVDAAGRQVALRLTEAQLWELGAEVARALTQLRSG